MRSFPRGADDELTTFDRDDAELREALHLIKLHITESGELSRDLHEAVQKIVSVARRHGLLLD